jgi:hypothetical protein
MSSGFSVRLIMGAKALIGNVIAGTAITIGQKARS